MRILWAALWLITFWHIKSVSVGSSSPMYSAIFLFTHGRIRVSKSAYNRHSNPLKWGDTLRWHFQLILLSISSSLTCDWGVPPVGSNHAGEKIWACGSRGASSFTIKEACTWAVKEYIAKLFSFTYDMVILVVNMHWLNSGQKEKLRFYCTGYWIYLIIVTLSYTDPTILFIVK